MSTQWVQRTFDIEAWVSPKEGLAVTGEILSYTTRATGRRTRIAVMKLLEPCEVVDEEKTTAKKKAFRQVPAGTIVAVDDRHALREYFDAAYLGPIRMEFGKMRETNDGGSFWPVTIYLPAGAKPVHPQKPVDPYTVGNEEVKEPVNVDDIF